MVGGEGAEHGEQSERGPRDADALHRVPRRRRAVLRALRAHVQGEPRPSPRDVRVLQAVARRARPPRAPWTARASPFLHERERRAWRRRL